MSLLGSIGSIAGGAIGSYFGGPAGGAAGSSFGSLLAQNADKIGQGIGDLVQSGASSAIGYAADMKQAEKLMSMQYDMQRKLALNKYPWEVASLEAAGLNPILAATRGASAYSANAPVINAKRGQEAISSAAQLAQIDNLQAQNDLIRSQALSASSSAQEIQERTRQIKRLNDFLDKYPELFKAGQIKSNMPSNPIGFSGFIPFILQDLLGVPLFPRGR